LITNENGTTYRDFVPFKVGNFLFNLYELKGKCIVNFHFNSGKSTIILSH